MCGIVGIYNFLSDQPVARGTLSRMAQTVAHRGPDDQGYFVAGALGLAHRRLSILDTSTNGRQPMVSADRQLAITYNGEIYNYIELREELRPRGYTFHTGTDTEIILRAYEEWGEACLERFTGMFAFALWDGRDQRLFLARDRMGIKPLYYVLTSDGLRFASELKALASSKEISTTADSSALDDYMIYGFIPGEKTLIQGIKKLPAAHALRVVGRQVTTRRYWDIRFTTEACASDAVYAQRLHDLLQYTVRTHLRSDVPVGVLLSGGLDSSTITALVSHGNVGRVKTFSVAFDCGPEYNETTYAQLVSQQFATEHFERIITPREFRDSIPNLVWHMDEPTTDSAAVALYHVAQLARDHVKVILSGEGADELFAGYEVYFNMHLLEYYRRLPSFLRRAVRDWVSQRRPYSKLAKYCRLSEYRLGERYMGPNVYDRALADYLYAPEFAGALAGYRAEDYAGRLYQQTAHTHTLNQMLYLDSQAWLVDDILLKADRMSMAHSLELRVPFLDHSVVEFAAALPPRLKLNRRTGKYVLRAAMRDFLPPVILKRKKMGFPTPLMRLLRGELKDYVHDLLTSTRAVTRGYFRPERVHALVEDFMAGYNDYSRLIWQLLILEEWQRTFSDGDSPALNHEPRAADDGRRTNL